MRKLIFLFLITFCVSQADAQRYMSRNGHIWFFSDASLEDIEAHNRQASSVIDASAGKIAFSMLIKGFEFQKALMQEHFNEKYMESDKYPKSTFEGEIINIKDINFQKNGTYPAKVKGELTIHGITHSVEVPGTLIVKDGGVSATAKFPVRLKDYEIAIPTVVKDKIAEVVDVNVDIVYSKMEK